MAGIWKTIATVKPGGVIELVLPDLTPGEQVEVVVHQNGLKHSTFASPRPGFGADRGKITISDDFDAPLEDFKEYM